MIEKIKFKFSPQELKAFNVHLYLLLEFFPKVDAIHKILLQKLYKLLSKRELENQFTPKVRTISIDQELLLAYCNVYSTCKATRIDPFTYQIISRVLLLAHPKLI